jgi:hypothetical protein
MFHHFQNIAASSVLKTHHPLLSLLDAAQNKKINDITKTNKQTKTMEE